MQLKGIVVVLLSYIASVVDVRAASAANAGTLTGAVGRSLSAPGRTLAAPKKPGSPADPADKKPVKFNPCSPNPCFDYQTIEAHYPHYEKRQISSGKWLRVNTKPYNASGDELQLYNDFDTKITHLKPSVPALVKVDLGPNHVQRLRTYNDKMAALGEKMKSETQKMYQGASLLRGSGSSQTLSGTAAQELRSKFMSLRTNYTSAYSRLSDEAKIAYRTYAKDWSVTVYNYLHPDYQPTINGPAKETPPVQTNPNLSYVSVPEFSVFVKGYTALGLKGALEFTNQLGEKVNQTNVDTIYMANYANGFYEVWIPINKAVKLFP